MTGRRRRELADSFRLVASDERWLPRDMVLGAVALALWVGATGALAARIGDSVGVPLGLAGEETVAPEAIALFAVLWLAVPALAVLVWLRRRTLNIRGNVEQYYRLDHPSALLAPPVVLLVGVSLASVALGSFSWGFALLMVPVGLFLLVRTLAFSYRVYSFSHPLVVQALALLSTVAVLASAATGLAVATGRESTVDAVLVTAGLPPWIAGTVLAGTVTVTGPAVGALAPVFLAGVYLAVQTAVAVVVRVVEPDVDRSVMRTGQRYPSFSPNATSAVTPASSAAPEGPRGAADGGSGTSDDGGTDGTAAGGSTADGDGSDGTDGPDDDGDATEDLDDVSNTRIFTPPADEPSVDVGFDGPGDAGSTPSESASDGTSETRAAARSAASEDEEPGAGPDYCDACGESVAVDAAVRFCPNCGTAFDGE